MKKFLLNGKFTAILIGAIVLFQLSSCEKNDVTPLPTTHTIEGLWIGSYTVNGQPNLGNQYFSFSIKPDGTVVNDTKGENMQHLNIGNWTLTGDSLSCTTTCVYGLSSNLGVVEKHTAKFDKIKGTLTNGIWKNVPPMNGSGTFSLTKVE